jgi:dGTPase
MSDNYRRLLEHPNDRTQVPLRYRELQLLTDMVSGMTDGFVMHIFRELEPLAHA